MTPWWLQPGFVAFDTETTGTDPASDRIVTAAAIRFVEGEPAEVRTWMLAIDIPIPASSSAIHGVTDEVSQRDGMDQAEGLAGIRDYLHDGGLPIVAFNSDFDLRMLDANLRRRGIAPLRDPLVLCPLVIDKQFNKYVRGPNQRRLAPTAGRYGLELSEADWHGAEADAIVTGRILLAQFAAYAPLREYTADDLARSVGVWRGEQEADFQAWLASRAT